MDYSGSEEGRREEEMEGDGRMKERERAVAYVKSDLIYLKPCHQSKHFNRESVGRKETLHSWVGISCYIDTLNLL